MPTRFKQVYLFVLVILAEVLSPGGVRAADLYVCDDPQIVGASAAFDVTPGGHWVVGTTNGRVFRWSGSAGLEILSPPEWLHTHTAGVSDDGTMITSTVADDLGVFQPSRWIEGVGWEPMGGLPGEPPLDGSYGSGWDISGDGSVIVGLGWHSTYRAEGFRWDAASGVVGLGHPAGRNSRATGISADGSVIVGFYESESAGYRRPARWIEGGAVDLFLGEETYGETDSTSSDGRTLVGQYAHVSMVMAIGFTFTDTVGATPLLPILDGDYQGSYAGGVSDSGVVVGWSGNQSASAVEAAIWLPGDERMRSLKGYLVDLGVDVPPGVSLISAIAISADGSTVVGQAIHPDLPPGTTTFFVATIPNALFADGFEGGDTGAWTVPVIN